LTATTILYNTIIIIMGCGSSKETAVATSAAAAAPKVVVAPKKTRSSHGRHGFTERKGPDFTRETQKRQASINKSSTLAAESSAAGSSSSRGNDEERDDIDDDSRRYTKTQTLQLGHLKVRYACVSQRGRDPDSLQKPNQDSYSHHGTFLQNNKNNNDNDESAFFGVYDGHGPTGQECSVFVKHQLPIFIQSQLNEHYSLNSNIIQESLKQAHLQCNQALHAEADIDDSYSGTTCISLLLQPDRVIVSNVGDSRAILGTPQQQQPSSSTNNNNSSNPWTAVPLSQDQTPRRHDEAARCRQAGARILSFGQVNNDDVELDDVEDPPRVWAPDGKYPGTAFTRSLGDRVAKQYGVCAEPEVMPLSLSSKTTETTKEEEEEKNALVIILASDGIFDVMTNQQVVDICAAHYYNNNMGGGGADPYAACQEIVRRSHQEWLRNDHCTSSDDPAASYDDMTVLVLMLGEEDMDMMDTAAEKNKQEDESSSPSKENPTAEAAAAVAPVVVSSDTKISPPSTTTDATATTTHKRRVRQKTLRKIEDGPQPMDGGFFAPTTATTATTTTNSTLS
jgi:serine/threonine protein phosphatase PrpC